MVTEKASWSKEGTSWLSAHSLRSKLQDLDVPPRSARDSVAAG